MTKLLLKTSDQLLSLVSCKQPTLASGNVCSIQLSVNLCNEWVGYTTSAIFFTVKKHEEVYEKLLVSNTCKIPKEVLVDADCVYIGLRGVNIKDSTIVKVSSLVKIKITKGAPEGTAEIIEPTSTIYQQLMSAYGNHVNNTDIHVTLENKKNWTEHDENASIHVTSEDKKAWNKLKNHFNIIDCFTEFPEGYFDMSYLWNLSEGIYYFYPNDFYPTVEVGAESVSITGMVEINNEYNHDIKLLGWGIVISMTSASNATIYSMENWRNNNSNITLN